MINFGIVEIDKLRTYHNNHIWLYPIFFRLFNFIWVIIHQTCQKIFQEKRVYDHVIEKVDRYTRCIHNISSYQRIFSHLQKLKRLLRRVLDMLI